MRRFSIFSSILFLVLSGCSKFDDGDTSFLQTGTAPQELETTFQISDDNKGTVTISPSGMGASQFLVAFGDTSQTPATVQVGKSVTHRYAEGNYTVSVTGVGLTGKETTSTFPLVVTYRPPENIAVTTVANAHELRVSATADFAEGGFLVFFGDKQNETGTAMAPGSFVVHRYAAPGTYTLKVVALSGGKATSEKEHEIRIYNPLTLPMTFEDPNVNYAWGDFGGSGTSVVENPYKQGINTSDHVTKIVKWGGETWAGNFIILTEPLDLTQKHVFKVKAWSARAGMRVQLQLERNGDNNFQDHREVVTSRANEWEVLTFDFTGVDNSKRLQNILFFIDNGIVGDGSANYTLYIDDIELTN